MDRKTKGRVAEAKVLAYLVENGYEVYTPFSDCTKVDLVAIKDNDVFRVSVKYTSAQAPSGAWKVALANNSRQADGTNVHRLFDRDSVDLLAVYVGPLDMVLLKLVDFDAKYAIYVTEESHSPV